MPLRCHQNPISVSAPTGVNRAKCVVHSRYSCVVLAEFIAAGSAYGLRRAGIYVNFDECWHFLLKGGRSRLNLRERHNKKGALVTGRAVNIGADYFVLISPASGGATPLSKTIGGNENSNLNG